VSPTPREELSGVIWAASNNVMRQEATLRYADAVLAAGYRKLRIITTTTELDALPVRSVILAANGEPFIAHNYDRRDGQKKLWSTGGSSAGAFDSEWFIKPVTGAGLPAIVLSEPEAA